MVITEANQAVMVLLRGDHSLNEIKLAKVLQQPFRFARSDEIETHLQAPIGYLGPVASAAIASQKVRLLVDGEAAALQSFVCGANERDFHFRDVCWQRDVPLAEVAEASAAS